MNMRQSKRMRSRSPGLWQNEYSWEERVDGRKRRRRDSHSSERENKSRRQHSHYRPYDGHYLETRNLNQKPASRDSLAYRDASGAMGYKDGRGPACRDPREPRDREPVCRDQRDARDQREIRDTRDQRDTRDTRDQRDMRDREWHHYSKSSCRSGRSGRSRRSRSRRRDRGRRRSPSHHSSYSRRSHRRRKRSRSVEDDGEGHLIYHIGDMLRARYEIMSTLGEGAFGKVVECIDHNNGGPRMALKIIKNIDRYREAALSEVEVLEQMNSLDYDRKYPCVRMLDWFDYHGHVCIAFELLGLSTYDFLKENNFQPFPIENIQHMAYSIVRACRFLHKNKLTHTDLKPENILFIDSQYDIEYSPILRRDQRTLKNPEVKVVDFGNATYEHEHHTSVVSTRHYRAPEVILDLGWDHSCDVWSIGCILVEYYLGTTLFQTHDSKEHLAMMERILGPIPTHLLQKTRIGIVFSRKRRYVHRYKLDWDGNSSSGRFVKKSCKPLKEYMMCQSEDHQNFFDMVEKMMAYDPAKRLTLEQAMRHPFLAGLHKTNSSRNHHRSSSNHNNSSSSRSSRGSKF
ncbi:dual specificity protein kinase CLK4-like isoform X2 [Gadus chalcogrammus]|uniref:dual specificity protein kinase CLK4-like isoform X2 n=1 Tax=Gadus chalcogrammus TaxID=1042646 RepID=UPI0024C4917B|nr:dual specificity protein kinase CLK4-like isoform X2 [Gadus chalcogrammus]